MHSMHRQQRTRDKLACKHAQTTADKGQAGTHSMHRQQRTRDRLACTACTDNNQQGTSWHTKYAQTTRDKLARKHAQMTLKQMTRNQNLKQGKKSVALMVMSTHLCRKTPYLQDMQLQSACLGGRWYMDGEWETNSTSKTK